MINIIGAGMAGLLAARMLARYKPVVWEAQSSLPHNHSAVLRFRTPQVGDILGIPFKKVRMIKSTISWRGPVADDLAYSFKVTGVRSTDRSIPRETISADRWIAPHDFISRLAEGVDIRFGYQWNFFDGDEKAISTIPMPSLMRALLYEPRPTFLFRKGVNFTATIRDCDAYASIYIPNPDLPFSRVSITGDQLIIECHGSSRSEFTTDGEEVVKEAVKLLGISPLSISHISLHDQTYAKILPIDEGERRTFIHWASTLRGRAFSLGRFATWRPGLLLDDLIQDVRVIEGLMNSNSPGYDAERIERTRRK